ncbi:MAG: spore coat protein CotJB [Firmicutes bacterium]|nr:spore coat protein CotJB [Bacillota bacterium]
MCYSFAITDMNLYLDVHPEDRKALTYLKELIVEEEKAKKEYIMKYGPLNVCDTKGDKFDWINGPWSWENLGGNIYV